MKIKLPNPIYIIIVILSVAKNIIAFLIPPFLKRGYKKLPKFAQKALSVVLITTTLTIGTGLIYLISPWWNKGVQAVWFDDNFAYRQYVALTNAGTAQTDFQISITLDTATLVTAGKMQSDCDDIRVTDINGKVLPYWLETGSTNACNQASTRIWVNVPSIPTSGATLYLYYGNPSAISKQNGAKVFPTFFDDFSSDNISTKWQGNTAPATITSGTMKLVIGAQAASYGQNPIYSQTSSLGTDYVAEALTYQAEDNTLGDFQVMMGSTSSFYGMQHETRTAGEDGDLAYWNGAGSIVADGRKEWAVNEKVRHRASISGTSITVYSEDIDTTSTNRTISYTDINSVSHNFIGFRDEGSTGFYVDWVMVRKYAATPPSVASPASEEKAPSPVAYWKFDEGTGTNANDATSNNKDGTISGATWQTEDQCISGKCLYFDGSDDYVETTGNLGITGSSPWTLSTWFKLGPNGSQFDNIISIGQQGTNLQVFAVARGTTTSNLNINVWGTNQTTDSSSIDFTKYYSHMVATYDGTTYRIYINGKLLFSNTATFNIINNPVRIGGRTGGYVGQYLHGFIDEPKIYNYARSAAQIQADYNARANDEGASAVLGAQNQPAALSNGLVGYYKMDESSWTVDCLTESVVDSSGNTNNGASCPTTTGPAGGAAGKFGNAGSFDGTNDYIDVDDAANLDFGTGSFSISYWGKSNITAGVADYAVGKLLNGTTFDGYHIGVNASGYGTFIWRTDSTNYAATGSTDLTDNAWHHYVGVRNSTGIYMYVDGVLVGTNTNANTQTNEDNDQPLAIGGARTGDTGELWQGSLDEARIYNRALSSNDISTLYNFAPGPVGYWKMEEKSGTSANDSSGNGQTGTLSSGATFKNGKYGSASNFDSTSNGLITVADNAAQRPQEITVSYWMYQNAQTAFGVPLTKATNSAWSDGWGFYNRGGSSQFTWWTNAYQGTNRFVTITVPSVGTWHHVAGTFDTTNGAKLYIDGVLAGTASSTTAITHSTASLKMGYHEGGGGLDGKIDDVKIYNYARTQGQIIQDMNAGHPAPGSPVGTPLGYWKFDEGANNMCSGGTNDTCNSGSVGSGIDGAGSGFASPATSTSGWTQSGKFGKALIFDGTDDDVNVADNSTLDISGSLTISAWVKPTTLNTVQVIAAKWVDTVGNDQRSYQMYLDANNKLVAMFSPDCINSPNRISTLSLDSNWHHVVGVLEAGSTIKVYIDGKDVSGTLTGTVPSSVCNSTASWRIGEQSTDSYPFAGSIDEVKIYGQALTAEQVKLDMNRSSSQVMGAISDNSSYQVQAANQEYCVPGDSTSCAAPVGRWDFEEGTSTVVNDSSGNANTGTWNGTGSHWKSGKVGKGGNFNGSDDYVSSANSISTGTSGTMEAWIKPSGTYTSPQTVMGGTDAGGSNVSGRYYISAIHTGVCASGDWWVNIANGTTNQFVCSGQVYNSTNFPANTWTHLVATYDGTNVRFYKDGRLVNTVSQTVSGAGDAQPFSIGRPGGASTAYYNGGIDQVKIFNYARSAAQIAWDYNKGGPVGQWKMDECQGTVANDSSGNSNTGTITIGATGTQTSAGTCTGSANTAWKDGVTGKRNYSIDLDGTDDYVTSASSTGFTTGANPKSISAWIKASTIDTDWRVVAAYGAELDNSSYGILVRTQAGGQWGCYHYGGANDLYSSKELQTGIWYYITCTYDGTTAKLYLNGNLEASGARTLTTTATVLTIGKRQSTSGGYFAGQIDDARVYNYALTANQVKSLMNEGATRFGPTTGAP